MLHLAGLYYTYVRTYLFFLLLFVELLRLLLQPTRMIPPERVRLRHLRLLETPYNHTIPSVLPSVHSFKLFVWRFHFRHIDTLFTERFIALFFNGFFFLRVCARTYRMSHIVVVYIYYIKYDIIPRMIFLCFYQLFYRDFAVISAVYMA